METAEWILRAPLRVVRSVDNPYLLTGEGVLGGHDLAIHFAPETAGRGDDLQIFLDGGLVYSLGMMTPGEPWYRLCRELGFRAEAHWDLDPALILFRQVVPALALNWRERPLPFPDLGLPDGVVCLATVQAAWAKGVATLTPHDPAAEAVASCLRALPLRAVVFHDDPGRREDFLGTGVDDPLLGVYVHFGQTPQAQVTLAKGTLNGTGGLRWSPWEIDGEWREAGREWAATRGPEAFRTAAGLGAGAPEGFQEAFLAAMADLVKALDPAVEQYRQTYPAAILWHRDPCTRFLNHMIVGVRRQGDLGLLVLDDGSEVAVLETGGPSQVSLNEAPENPALQQPSPPGQKG